MMGDVDFVSEPNLNSQNREEEKTTKNDNKTLIDKNNTQYVKSEKEIETNEIYRRTGTLLRREEPNWRTNVGNKGNWRTDVRDNETNWRTTKNAGDNESGQIFKMGSKRLNSNNWRTRDNNTERSDARRNETSRDISIKNSWKARETNTVTSVRARDSSRNRSSYNPIGYRKLDEWNNLVNFNDIALRVLGALSYMEEILSDPDIKHDLIQLVIEILSKVCKASTTPQTKISIFSNLFHQNSIFMRESVATYLITLRIGRYTTNEKTLTFVESLIDVVNEVLLLLPTRFNYMPVDNLIIFGRKYLTTNEELQERIKALESTRNVILKESVKMKNRRILSQGQPPPDDYRGLDSYPTVQDLQSTNKPYLRKVQTKGAYLDGQHYLDVQFRLLKEDLVAPLREGIQEIIKNIPRAERKYPLKIYKEVQHIDTNYAPKGICHKIKFDTSKIIKDYWKYSKNMKFNSLLCFTKDNFKTLLVATIEDRNDIEKGELEVRFVDSFEATHYFQENSNSMIMVESPSFFEAYKHVLDGIKEIHQGLVPMESYIVYCKDEVEKPLYCSYVNLVYDLSNILKIDEETSDDGSKVEILKPDMWPACTETILNDAQFKAFQHTLTSEFSVIQGPPGTGKTYIGLMIAETLLLNKTYWNKSKKNPMLVVCYTNHALDQFLQGLIDRGQESIIRVGSRYNADLDKYSLRTVQRNTDGDGYARRSATEIWKKERNTLKDYINRLNKLNNFHQQGKLLSFKEVRGVMLPRHMQYFEERNFKLNKKGRSVIELFLGISVQYEREENDTIDNDLIDSDKKYETVQSKVDRLKHSKQVVDLYEIYDVDSEKEEEEIGEEEQQEDKEDEGDDDDENETEDTNGYQQDENTIDNTMVDSNEEYKRVQSKADKVKRIKEILHKQHSKSNNMNPESVDNPWKLETDMRWQLYKYWFEQYKNEFIVKIEQQLIEYENAGKVIEEVREKHIELVLNEADVIGMTTTGAARNRRIIKNIQPRVVIIEEAAEVLEAHVLTSITSYTEHLILIGDHKQLRPSQEVYELAKKYHFDVSLFERMVNNGTVCQTLDIQHRMRPEIAKLVRHIYPRLKNHDAVYDYPHIKGIEKDVLFISHNKEEQENQNMKSKENEYEANYLTSLCRYLLKQGYQPNQITVLTGYTAQLIKLKNKMPHPEFKDVRITVVDNFQGEENDIILLSLVRSNSIGKIGFLEIENRICVALSRAKHGLYVIGNFDLLESKSTLWRNIITDVKEMGCLKNNILLHCQKHPDELIEVLSGDDFKKSPDGGCNKPCGFRLECGHSCNLKCHTYNPTHKGSICNKICGKEFPCEHKCKNQCHPQELCKSCNIIVEKIMPECKHLQNVLCSLASSAPCRYPMKKVMLCEHVQPMECSSDPSTEICNHPCDKQLSCGHQCTMKCHMGKECTTICCHLVQKTIPKCQHRQQMQCSADPNKIACTTECSKDRLCGHQCKDDCHFENDCESCKIIVEKKNPNCGHMQRTECYQSIPQDDCKSRCLKVMPCGHKCQNICHFENKCMPCRIKVKKQNPNCGHIQLTECYQSIPKEDCENVCLKVMPCEHKCQETCHFKTQCNPCKVIVEKMHPECNHIGTMQCFKDPIEVVCSFPCSRFKKCGHKCTGKCGEPCSKVKCKKIKQVTLACNHIKDSLCYWNIKNLFCKEICQGILKCSHLCDGVCGNCKRGRLHEQCQETCTSMLPCCHPCKERCASECQPCNLGCQNTCAHKKCKEVCSKPCVPCSEPCLWKCKHQECSMLCYEVCDRKPCNEPCDKILACGHKCIGLCGENCPALCMICDKERIVECFLGTERGPNARFVSLLDCKHIFEVTGFDTWMTSGDTELKKCPQCGTVIRRSWRYGNFVKNALKAVEYQKITMLKAEDSFTITTQETKAKLQDVVKSHFDDKVTQMVTEIFENDKLPPKRRMRRICIQSNKHVFILASHIIRSQDATRAKILWSLTHLYERFLEFIRGLSSNNVCLKQMVRRDITDLENLIENPFLNMEQIIQCHTEIRRLSLHCRMSQLALKLNCDKFADTEEVNIVRNAIKEFEDGHYIPSKKLDVLMIHCEEMVG